MRQNLCCDRCQSHLGWINGNEPRGFVYCDECLNELFCERNPRAVLVVSEQAEKNWTGGKLCIKII